MDARPNIAWTGALLGDPTRATILETLLDDRARTATELSQLAGVSPQTTSNHLTKLVDAGLLLRHPQGRHRYYRIADAEVAHALEALANLAVRRPQRKTVSRPPDSELRHARTCYDHLAGSLGVGLAQAMVERRYLNLYGNDFILTKSGIAVLTELGISVEKCKARRRAFAPQCIDWSERRPHLAGSLGAALASSLFELGWIRRINESRAVKVTSKGRDGLGRTFSIAFS